LNSEFLPEHDKMGGGGVEKKIYQNSRRLKTRKKRKGEIGKLKDQQSPTLKTS